MFKTDDEVITPFEHYHIPFKATVVGSLLKVLDRYYTLDGRDLELLKGFPAILPAKPNQEELIDRLFYYTYTFRNGDEVIFPLSSGLTKVKVEAEKGHNTIKVNGISLSTRGQLFPNFFQVIFPATETYIDMIKELYEL